jgi:SRSO17 transposase
MGDDEVRSWHGWHHHMTLVILAHVFLVQMQIRLKKTRQP